MPRKKDPMDNKIVPFGTDGKSELRLTASLQLKKLLDKEQAQVDKTETQNIFR